MTHPILEAHGTFHGHVKLGKKKPKLYFDLPRLENYLAIPDLPTSVDYTTKNSSWPMYGNDSLGDCTCACPGHMVQAWSSELGSTITVPDADIEELYWETGDPPSTTGTAGGPTDDGRDIGGVCLYWQQTGFPNDGNKIDLFAGFDITQFPSLQAAIALFGGANLGVALPITAQTQSIWDVNGDPTDPNSPAYPGSWGGHCIPGLAYDENGNIKVITWGAVLTMTKAFFTTYCDEGYALISPDWLNAQGDTLAGLNLTQLQADLMQIAQEQNK